MTAPPRSDMLLARLRLLVPSARSILVTGARSHPSALATAESLAHAASRTGLNVHWLALSVDTRASGMPEGVDDLSLLASDLQDVVRARQALAGIEGYTVIAGAGILDDPRTLLLSAAADTVVVVAWQGKTTRSDLEGARIEIERAGGQLAGAVLVG